MSQARTPTHGDAWPDLPLADWADTRATLHLWTQIVGKVRLSLAPRVNHSWHVPLYVSARGLTTSLIPHGRCALELEFDFHDHALHVRCARGGGRSVALAPRSVADFHAELMARLAELGHPVAIHGSPNELPDPIPFADDHVHASYDADAAGRFAAALRHADRALQEFRGRFLGKCSPVHFFWGSFDMAVSRFSGRDAPVHPGGIPNLPDRVTREAYSHELHSCGWWPGDERLPEPAFYAYAYPIPPGFANAIVEPAQAYFHSGLGEFVLPWSAVRALPEPDEAVLRFAESTYAAAADAGGWDRAALEWSPADRRG